MREVQVPLISYIFCQPGHFVSVIMFVDFMDLGFVAVVWVASEMHAVRVIKLQILGLRNSPVI
jgi:hypothetical protein